VHTGRSADHLRLTNPKLDERDVAIAMLDHDPTLLADRVGQTLLADKGYA
jgi:hypothetical protein